MRVVTGEAQRVAPDRAPRDRFMKQELILLRLSRAFIAYARWRLIKTDAHRDGAELAFRSLEREIDHPD